jgi:hypothetical protein
MVEPFRPTGTPTFPLHRPSELVYADIRRTAVHVGNCVSYATDFVWDPLLPSALPIADPPPRPPLHEGLRRFEGEVLGVPIDGPCNMGAVGGAVGLWWWSKKRGGGGGRNPGLDRIW